MTTGLMHKFYNSYKTKMISENNENCFIKTTTTTRLIM